jgi:hypothetical protein
VQPRARRLILLTAILLPLLGPGLAHASPITYTLDQTVGSGSVTGTITTDGTLGTLAVSNITAWDLNLLGAGGVSLSLNNANSSLEFARTDLSATATDLSFNFSATDNGYLVVQETGYHHSGYDYYCDSAGNGTCYAGISDVPGYYKDSSAQYDGTPTGAQVIATAVPEPAALALLALPLTALAFLRRRTP